jgi:two-component sensor histidine kinase
MKFILPALLALVFICKTAHGQNDSNAVVSLHTKIDGFIRKNQNDSVIFYAKAALELSKKINYKQGIAKSLSSEGIGYMHKGEYPKALENFFKALSVYESLKNKNGILVQYGNIGIVYDNQNDNEKALEYYSKALDISEETGDRKHASIQYCNIAIVYTKKGMLPKAGHYFMKAMEMDSIMGDRDGVARNLINLGSVFLDRKLYNDALNYFSRGLAITEKEDNKPQMAGCLVNLGYTYMDMKDYKTAETYMLRSLKTLEEVDDLNLKSEVEKLVSDFYIEAGRHKEAMQHYKAYVSLRDSVYNEENTKKSLAAEMNYGFEKKQAVTQFEHDRIVYELEAENKLHRQLRLFLIIFIVLVLVLLFFAKRAYDNKKRIAEFMGSESERKEVLLQEVQHRINNNLQIISGLLTLQADNAGDAKLSEYLRQSRGRIESLSVVHELLYKSDASLTIKMDQYINQVLDFHRSIALAGTSKVTIETTVTDTGFASKYAVPIALIVNEAVTNSLKYAFDANTDGKIFISLLPVKNEAGKWRLYISDTGKGLPEENNFRKDSLGIRLVSIMSKQIGGILTKSNSPGATFEVVFTMLE